MVSVDRLDFSHVDRVYIDAVLAISSLVPGSSHKRQADTMFARLIASKVGICVSTLLFDELWYKTFRLLYSRDNPGQAFPLNDTSIPKKYYSDIRTMSDKIFSLPRVELLSIPSNVRMLVDDALSLIDQASLYPRDAFHVALARAHGIQYLISNDRQLLDSPISNPIVISF